MELFLSSTGTFLQIFHRQLWFYFETLLKSLRFLINICKLLKNHSWTRRSTGVNNSEMGDTLEHDLRNTPISLHFVCRGQELLEYSIYGLYLVTLRFRSLSLFTHTPVRLPKIYYRVYFLFNTTSICDRLIGVLFFRVWDNLL